MQGKKIKSRSTDEKDRKIRIAPYPQSIRAKGENLGICFLHQLFIEPLSSADVLNPNLHNLIHTTTAE